jgi:hypothetical protein
MLIETQPFRERDGHSHVLADSHWEMLLKAVDIRWEFLKGYRKAARECPKAIEKLLGNS